MIYLEAESSNCGVRGVGKRCVGCNITVIHQISDTLVYINI